MRGGVGQPDQHTLTEPVDQLVLDARIDRVVTGLAGEVGLVDQATEGVRDLPGPDRVGVDLTGAVKITQ